MKLLIGKSDNFFNKFFCRKYLAPYLCHPKNGSLAQLVQSICLTSRGSAVRPRQLPLKRKPNTDKGFRFFYVYVFLLNGTPISSKCPKKCPKIPITAL